MLLCYGKRKEKREKQELGIFSGLLFGWAVCEQ